MPARSSLPSKVYSSSCPPALSARRQSLNSSGIEASGSSRLSVNCFLPSFFISSIFSSTTISSPLWITPIRSAISSASSMYWVVRMIVTPLSRSLRTSAHMSRRSSTSTPAVGSSKNRISGSCDRALAIKTRRFMPPDKVMILSLRFSRNERARSTFSTIAGFGAHPKSPRLKLTVAHTVSNMSVVSSCGTRPTLDRAAR